jgi:hypothetical protein
VDAALGLARALGTTVEELFSDWNVAVVALSDGRGHDVNLADARPRAGILN